MRLCQLQHYFLFFASRFRKNVRCVFPLVSRIENKSFVENYFFSKSGGMAVNMKKFQGAGGKLEAHHCCLMRSGAPRPPVQSSVTIWKPRMIDITRGLGTAKQI